jgi:leucyl-tRNA synthetase
MKRAQTTAGSDAWNEAVRSLVLLAAPVFPHVAEELWTDVLGLGYSVHQQRWPRYDESVLRQAQITLVVQVNGRVRDQVVVDAAMGKDEAQMRDLVLELPKVKQHIAGATVRKFVFVPGKLANVVAN